MKDVIAAGSKDLCRIRVIASFIAIFQFAKDQMYGKRSVSALYRHSIVAASAHPFDISEFVQDDLKAYPQIVLVTAVIWNSGQEPIAASEIRRPVLVEFEEGIRIVAYKLAG